MQTPRLVVTARSVRRLTTESDFAIFLSRWSLVSCAWLDNTQVRCSRRGSLARLTISTVALSEVNRLFDHAMLLLSWSLQVNQYHRYSERQPLSMTVRGQKMVAATDKLEIWMNHIPSDLKVTLNDKEIPRGVLRPTYLELATQSCALGRLLDRLRQSHLILDFTRVRYLHLAGWRCSVCFDDGTDACGLSDILQACAPSLQHLTIDACENMQWDSWSWVRTAIMPPLTALVTFSISVADTQKDSFLRLAGRILATATSLQEFSVEAHLTDRQVDLLPSALSPTIARVPLYCHRDAVDMPILRYLDKRTTIRDFAVYGLNPAMLNLLPTDTRSLLVPAMNWEQIRELYYALSETDLPKLSRLEIGSPLYAPINVEDQEERTYWTNELSNLCHDQETTLVLHMKRIETPWPYCWRAPDFL